MTDAPLTRLCATADVSEDEPFKAEVGDVAFAVFQLGDDYFVTDDLCSHGPGSLSEGFVVDGCQVECPFHQGRFDLRSGVPTYPPCEVAIRVWDAILRDDAIFIQAGSPKGV